MANDIFNYSVSTNTGKGFITHTDSRKFWIRGYPANVWVCADIMESRLWVARNNGVSNTKDQAQALVTTEVEAAQAAWDSETDEYKDRHLRPADITLP